MKLPSVAIVTVPPLSVVNGPAAVTDRTSPSRSLSGPLPLVCRTLPLTGASSLPLNRSSCATGGSFTGATVRVTVVVDVSPSASVIV